MGNGQSGKVGDPVAFFAEEKGIDFVKGIVPTLYHNLEEIPVLEIRRRKAPAPI